MTDAPRVSICIPCYNAERYIGAALDSVLAQSWPNLEIIVVDDGSTDHSATVLAEYTSRGVQVITQPNRGQCAAANAAFAASTGDYIKFFDADDLLSPRFVEHQMERLADGAVDVVASARWGRFQVDDPASFKLNPEPVWCDMESTDWLVESWRKARPMMQCALWLIPRPLLERAGPWNEELSLINDFEFFARVLCHSRAVRFAPDATLHYRSGLTGSLSGRSSRRAVESASHSLLQGTEHLLARRSDEAARLSCANMLQDFIYMYYPDHVDLRNVMSVRIAELGGSNLPPSGPPRFEQLTKLIGWRLARRIQRWSDGWRHRT